MSLERIFKEQWELLEPILDKHSVEGDYEVKEPEESEMAGKSIEVKLKGILRYRAIRITDEFIAEGASEAILEHLRSHLKELVAEEVESVFQNPEKYVGREYSQREQDFVEIASASVIE